MTWGATAVAGATLVGGYLSSEANKSAANTSADAQRYAADQAAQSARFTPVGITTNLGSSNFSYNPDGTIASAGYSLNPQLQGVQNSLFGQLNPNQAQAFGQAAQPLMGAGSQLFNLGGQYLAQNPNAVAQNWLTQQQNLLAPGREQELAQLQNQQFQTGRTGLSVGGTSSGYNGVGSPGLLATNPQMQALYNARAQQDATLAGQAQQQGQNQQLFGSQLYSQGAGLLSQVPSLTSAGYAPLTTQLGLIGSVEGLGQQPFDLSTALGAKQSTAGAQVGNALLTGGISAAKTQQAANQYSFPGAALQGVSNSGQLGNWFNNMIGNNNNGMALLNSSATSQDYMNNIGGGSNAMSSTQSSGNAPYANEWWMQ